MHTDSRNCTSNYPRGGYSHEEGRERINDESDQVFEHSTIKVNQRKRLTIGITTTDLRKALGSGMITGMLLSASARNSITIGCVL